MIDKWPVLLLGLATAGYLPWIIKFFKTSFFVSLFFLINIYILFIYAFAIVGLLDFSVNSIYFFGLILLVKNMSTRDFAQKLVNFRFAHLTWAIPFLLFLRAIPSDYRFTMFDEFPSWAANLKTLVSEHALGGLSSPTRFINFGFHQNYPPAQELFQYLIIGKLNWAESNVLIAQVLIILITLAAIADEFGRRRDFRNLISFASMIIIFYLFGLNVNNILAENFLSAQFAACLVFTLRVEILKRNLWILGICIGNLVLIKPTGLVFAFIPTLILIYRIGSYRSQHLSRITVQVRSRKRLERVALDFLKFTPSLLFPFIIYGSWQFFIRNLYNAPKLSSSFFSESNWRQRLGSILSSYKDVFFGSLFGPENLAGTSMRAPKIVEVLHISLFSIMAILVILHLVIIRLQNKSARRDYIFLGVFMTIMALCYQIFLLTLYVTFFGQYESERMAGLVRYTVPFIFAWTIVVFNLLIQTISDLRWHKTFLIFVFSGTLIVAPNSLMNDLKEINADPLKLKSRLGVESLIPRVQNIVAPENSIYFIFQDSSGFEKHVFSYLMLPNKTNVLCYSVGAPYGEKDVWTCDEPLDELLKGYDYLVLGNADDKFWEINTGFVNGQFDKTLDKIYKISFEKGRLILNPVNR
jgi:hypothetical protein